MIRPRSVPAASNRSDTSLARGNRVSPTRTGDRCKRPADAGVPHTACGFTLTDLRLNQRPLLRRQRGGRWTRLVSTLSITAHRPGRARSRQRNGVARWRTPSKGVRARWGGGPTRWKARDAAMSACVSAHVEGPNPKGPILTLADFTIEFGARIVAGGWAARIAEDLAYAFRSRLGARWRRAWPSNGPLEITLHLLPT